VGPPKPIVKKESLDNMWKGVTSLGGEIKTEGLKTKFEYNI
jgi:hypothetical protein